MNLLGIAWRNIRQRPLTSALTAVSLAWLASAVILLLGAKLSSFLGEKGITAIERLMGMVLVASAVQMFLDGAAKVIRP